MLAVLRARLALVALAVVLLASLPGPVMAQAVPGDDVGNVDPPAEGSDSSDPSDSIDPELGDGEINPVMYYSMGGDGCMACRGGETGAEEAASEAASSAADRAVDQALPHPADLLP
jgi:hypothetical protein